MEKYKELNLKILKNRVPFFSFFRILKSSIILHSTQKKKRTFVNIKIRLIKLHYSATYQKKSQTGKKYENFLFIFSFIIEKFENIFYENLMMFEFNSY